MRVLVALLFAGCVTVQGDGYYRCEHGRQCPSSVPICGSDGFCHLNGVDASTPVDAHEAPDMGPMPLIYESCIGMRPDMQCHGSDQCYYDTVVATSNEGYCTRACVGDGDCPAFDGAPSACVMGRCRRGSTGSADCPDTFGSATGRWEDGRALRLCVDLDIAEADWYETCSIDGDCERPLSCVNGYCLRACTTTGDCIQDLEVCVSSAVSSQRGCLYQCSGTPECTNLGAVCGSGGGCHPRTSW